ncbi:MgtC/SapB transporter [Geobacillus stearothermophilus]|uniref:MgtC/SapB family protein n=1 Tax=unclassified Geobacillus TaxID=2642459 RepID=UPI00050546F3|nr:MULTISPECIES: MgtC/SapB family protein [unclassified Geobacillus]AKM20176.1 putative Mg(2+) transport ATPase [Geobacillus sp. 12AMOR1]ATA61198.1 Mg2+ transporter [Geobacillus stearothermophilus]STO13478.1 putative Mg(2+) transport ATPase [[Flavobacterium] thermophilum]KFL15537.1 MgtC/SapB transporter [Geobacillus stearothermophilus]KFX36542.1 MgtC/SapB transporter [Geobacillus stearothermophilus]
MMFDPFLKLGISAILGLIIGLERELKRKPVGLKTCLVISISSCLLTIVSIESAYVFPLKDHITMDPLRLAAQIVSGVGFLGAGVILRRGNDSITGLTTAAIIWGAAGIGVAVGAGFYWESAFGVALLIVSVELIPFLINFFGPKQLREKEVLLQITVADAKNITKVIDHLKQQDINIKTMRIKDVEENEHLLKLRAVIDQKRSTAELYYVIRSIDAVVHVDIESG